MNQPVLSSQQSCQERRITGVAMILAVAAVVLHHVDGVPRGIELDLVDLVRAVLDERADGHPAAAIVRAEKWPLQAQLFADTRFVRCKLRGDLLFGSAAFGEPGPFSLHSFPDP